MSYSSSTYRSSFADRGQRVGVPQLKRGHDSGLPEMWVTSEDVDPKVSQGRSGRLYQVWVSGVELPEFPGHHVTACLATDTVKGRVLTVAAFMVNLPRPILLDMVRDNMSAWTKMKVGVVNGGGRSFWKTSDGVPYVADME